LTDAIEQTLQDLWLDRPDAAAEIERRLADGEITAQQSEKAEAFLNDGFVVVHLEGIEQTAERLRREVDQLWRDRRVDLAFRFVEEPTSMADARPRKDRMAPCRLLDIHSHSSAALDLYLHQSLFEWVEPLLGQPALAFESIFTEFGWSEAPYRDVVYIETDRVGHLLTATIALEDIDLAAGPYYVVPGSHRIPLYEFEPGRVRIRPEEDYLPAQRYAASLAAEQGLLEHELFLRKGEAVLWHPALIHGARRILRPWVTRRTFAVRFTTRGPHPCRRSSYWKSVRGRLWKKEKRLYWKETSRLLERHGLAGLDNPLRGLNPRGLGLLGKIRNRLRRR
jgi:phytanoyl-CoA hydroxylase